MFKYANPAICRMLGYTEEELRTLGVPDIHPKDAVQSVVAEFEAQVRGDKTLVTDIPCLKKDGSVVHVDINAFKMTVDGRPCNVGFFRDVTERKLAGEILRLRESFLSAITENQPGLLWLKDTEGHFLMVNKAFATACGRSAPEHVLGLTDLDIWPKELAEKYRHDDQQVMSTGNASMVEEMIFIGNSHVWFETFKTPVRDNQGRVIGTTGYSRDITERKQAEQLVTDALNFNQTMLRASPVGIVVFKATGPCVSANEAIAQIIGGPREEVLKQNFRQLESWKSSGMLAAAEAALAAQTERKLETQMLTTFGRKVWCFCRFAPFQYQGELHLLLLISDITERKRAEEAVRASENRLRTLVQTIPDLVWLKDTQGVFLFCNSAFERLFGARESAIIGKTDYDFVDKSLADFFRQHDQAAMAADGPTTNEEWLTFAHDGYRGLFQTIKTPMHDADGTLVGILGVARDITERKQAEQTLERTRLMLEAILEQSPVPIVVVSAPDLVLRYANRAATDFLGRSDEPSYVGLTLPETQQRQTWRVLRPDGTPFSADDMSIARALRGETTRNVEFSVIRKDGTQRWGLASGTPIYSRSGELMAALLVFSDITERKRAEERIREQAALLDAANDAIYVRTLDHTVTYWNDGAERLYGWTRAEALGRKITELGRV